VSRVLARGWATVELDRAETELHGLVGGAGFQEVERCSWLGARCRRARAIPSEAVAGEWIVLLEADAEGRLAAFLARHGEGWAATWAIEAGAHPTRDPKPGPLGPEILVPGLPKSGPFRLLVTAATIDP